MCREFDFSMSCAHTKSISCTPHFLLGGFLGFAARYTPINPRFHDFANCRVSCQRDAHLPSQQPATTKLLTLPKASIPKSSKSTQSAYSFIPFAVRPAHIHGCVCRVGELLRSYRAGPLPKPFKIIPSFPAWARILALTAPEQWSSQAAHAATRIFISNMKPQQARVYLEGVVLGLVRADLEQPSARKDARKLSPHLYEALKRALYKPAAFFKGIVFPLLDVSAMLYGHTMCFTLHCRTHTGRVYAQGSRDRRVRADKGQSAAAALVSRAHSPCGDGLLRCVYHAPHFFLFLKNTRTRAKQGRHRCSSACCWTRNTRCRTRCSTRSCSTLSGSGTRTRRARSPCSGTRACSCSASATRRTSRRNRRTRCATSCARTHTRRSRLRSAASSLRRPRVESRRRSRIRWIFRSVAFPAHYAYLRKKK